SRFVTTVGRLADGPVRLLYAGRLVQDKGIDLLVEILPRLMKLPNVQLTVIGRGIDDHPLCRANYPRYRYLGYIADRRQVAEIFREHQVFLAPGPHETFGLSVLEALAS